MEKLQAAIEEKEAQFIQSLKDLLGKPCSARIKIKLLYEMHVNTAVAINLLTTEAAKQS